MRWQLAGLLIGIQFWAGASLAAGSEDIDYVFAASLPPAVVEALAKFPQTAGYMLSTRINPYYVQGDFDGDGTRDTAVLVAEKAGGKKGVALVLESGVKIVGAGQPIGNGGDDFDWMDAWYVYERGKVEQGAFDGVPPTLKGDALMVIKTESASGLIYWNGSHFAWYQQGD